MLKKDYNVVFQWLWRRSCQFKPHKFFIDFDDHLCPHFEKGSATHDNDSEKAVHQTNLPDLLTIS